MQRSAACRSADLHFLRSRRSPFRRGRFGRFSGEDRFTTRESERLVRLPLYFGMTEEDRETVIRTALAYLLSPSR